MKRFRGHLVGVDQGTETLFSDFQDDGPMWRGEGPREARTPVRFATAFRSAPSVMVGLAMWDTGGDSNQRMDLRAEEVTAEGFDLVFRTWGDSRVARVRADWMAMGELIDDGDWALE